MRADALCSGIPPALEPYTHGLVARAGSIRYYIHNGVRLSHGLHCTKNGTRRQLRIIGIAASDPSV